MDKNLKILIIVILLIGLITFIMRKKISSVVSNFKIRKDSAGDGHFNTKRIGHRHQGIDFEVVKNQPIKAPFDLKFVRIAYPYSDDKKYSGGLWQYENGTIKMFYMLPLNNKKYYSKGETIGYAQDISEKYGKSMTPHVHLELRDKNGNLQNPENYI